MESQLSYNLTRLHELNDERVLELLPVIIYICILSAMGAFGNSLVLYIYFKRIKHSTSSYFIMYLAAVDIMVCAIGMPLEAIDLRNVYVFDNPAACKAIRFFTYSTVVVSAILLMAISMDRYFKVCRPHKMVGVRMKHIVIATLTLAALLASPALVVYGTKQVELEPGVIGFGCSISDTVKGTAWPIIYMVILALVFSVSVVCLLLLYQRVVYSLITQKRQMKNPVNTSLTRHRSEKGKQNKTFMTGSFKSTSDHDKVEFNAQGTPSVIMAAPQTQWKLPTKRTTVIFVCISIGYVLSFLPCLLIMTLREFVPSIVNFPNRAADIVYQIFLRSFFINYVINPLIYGLFNPSFRREVKRIFRLCGCRCCGAYNVTGNGPSSSNDTMLTSRT